MQNLFTGPKKHETPKQPSRLAKAFSSSIVLLSTIFTLHCGAPHDPGDRMGRREDGGSNGSVYNDAEQNQKPPHSSDAGNSSGEVLSAPEPCITQDREHSFSWTELDDSDRGFYGWDNSFPSSPIKMIWIVDLSEHATDRAFFTGEGGYDGDYADGTYNHLVEQTRLVRIGFRLRPNSLYEWSQAYAIAFLCAQREGDDLITARSILWRIMAKNGVYDTWDLYFFNRDDNTVDSVGFDSCRADLQGDIDQRTPDARILETLAHDQERIAAAGVTDDMPTPVFLLFNPDNNRCRSIYGAQPLQSFIDVIRYLGVDPDNWPPPSP